MSIKTWAKDNIEKKYQEHCIKKEQQFYQNMLRDTGHRGTDIIFNQETLAWLVVGVTGFLQIISLATTYEGSKVYFGGVGLPFGLSAPLLFALAIQLIMFCMSHTIRKHFKAWSVMILCMASLCSAYFSYIGIYNHINSPTDYLEERYQQIHGNITKKQQLVRDEAENGMKEYTFDLVREISKTHTALTKQVGENNVLSQKIAEVKVDSGKINVQTNNLKRPNINSYGENLDKYYEDMAKYNAAVGNMITDTTKQDADLKNQLYENEVKALLGGKTKDEFVNESIATQASKEQMEKVVSSMYQLINKDQVEKNFDEKLMEIQEYCLNFIIQDQGERDIFSTILTNLYTQVMELGKTDKLENFKEDLGQFITFSQKDTEAMKNLEEIKWQVYTDSHGIETNDTLSLTEEDAMLLYTSMQSEIKRAAYSLNQMNKLDKPIDLKAEEYIIHNLYVLPIKNLIEDSEAKAMSWFCLSFAILVDGLTLLFALMEGKEKTPLFAKSNKEIVGKSKEAIEELLLATIMDNHDQSKEGAVVKDTLLQLERFLKYFELMPEGMESGYSMWCPLNRLEEYKAFLAILCQFNLASILSKEDLLLLQGEGEVIDEKYVLIRTKFIIWAKQKITNLALKQEYIEQVQNLDRNFEGEGEMV